MTKKDIIALHEGRYLLLNEKNHYKTNESDETNEVNEIDKKIDELAEAIYGSLIGDFKTLEFEFILEQLANLGHCPNLLNDDNGHWTVTSNGFQTVVFKNKPENIETSFWIEAKEWKNTPREALWQYLLQE